MRNIRHCAKTTGRSRGKAKLTHVKDDFDKYVDMRIHFGSIFGIVLLSLFAFLSIDLSCLNNLKEHHSFRVSSLIHRCNRVYHLQCPTTVSLSHQPLYQLSISHTKSLIWTFLSPRNFVQNVLVTIVISASVSSLNESLSLLKFSLPRFRGDLSIIFRHPHLLWLYAEERQSSLIRRSFVDPESFLRTCFQQRSSSISMACTHIVKYWFNYDKWFY